MSREWKLYKACPRLFTFDFLCVGNKASSFVSSK